MKFILIIWVCSFLGAKVCLTPVEYPQHYNSWYECSRAAMQQSSVLLSKMGYKYVNEYKIGFKYHCKEVQTF